MPIISSTNKTPAIIELSLEDQRNIDEMDASIFFKAKFPEGINLAEWKTTEKEEEEG